MGWGLIRAQDQLAVESRLDAIVGGAAQIAPAYAWCGIVTATVLLGLLDAATGTAWFGPLYLLAICAATWAIGWRGGITIACLCAAVSVSANGVAVYPLGSVAIVWNYSMRAVAVLIIVALIGGVRRSFDREWCRARSDGLTGLPNRQAFLERSAIVRRRGGWGLLAYVDLDGLKRINDRDGHAAGDEMLRAFATGVQGIIRGSDVFARIGGDEFLLFLPIAESAEGPAIARQLHARMNRLAGPRSFAIRCSMGVTLIAPGGEDLSDADIHRADQLMYEAKREGAALRIGSFPSGRRQEPGRSSAYASSTTGREFQFSPS